MGSTPLLTFVVVYVGVIILCFLSPAECRSPPPSPLQAQPPPPPRSKLRPSPLHPPPPSKGSKTKKSKNPPPPPLLPPPPPPSPTHNDNKHPPPPPLRRTNKGFNLGKKIGLTFVGIAVVLQVFVAAFLVFKRRQLYNRY